MILVQSNRLVDEGRPIYARRCQISACRRAFPLRPDRGRKDCKVTPSRRDGVGSKVTVRQIVARSLDRRVGEPRTASKHPRGDHPSQTGSCDPGSTWANTLNKHAWSLAPDVPGTAPASVGAASRLRSAPNRQRWRSEAAGRRQLGAASHGCRAAQQPALESLHGAVRVRLQPGSVSRPARGVACLNHDHPVRVQTS